MPLVLNVNTAPVAWPIDNTACKTHMRITHANDDTYITALAKAAILDFETATHRQLITATYDLYMDDFPYEELEVPRPPLQSIESVKYQDGDDAQQTVTSSVYDADLISTPGRLYLDYNQTWPSDTRGHYNDVVVQFKAGYGDASTDVPEDILQALMMMVSHWYLNREPVVVGTVARDIPMTAQRIINHYRWEYVH